MRFLAVLGVTAFLAASAAHAQNRAQNEAAGLYAPSLWDLPLGAHARELPVSEYIDYACGTNGGPPALPLAGWSDYDKCRPEAGTGLREVYFRYDDQPEYWARARNLPNQIELLQYTSAFGQPVIASLLFDTQGFYVGYRLVSDPRAPVRLRENGVTLGGYLLSRYGDDGWACADLPHQEGETEYQGAYIKKRCTKRGSDDGIALDLAVETHLYRKRGQFAVDPRDNLPTEGQFESTTRFDAVMAEPVRDAAARLASITARPPADANAVHLRARDCAGCDLKGANLKRANLAGANLAGADLSGANLHGAILSGANLAGANLTRANVNRADLKQANLRNAILSEAMLFESRLDAADLRDANLTQALAGKVQLIRADLSGATMLAADLRNARLNEANLSGADLTQSWLHDAQATRANLSGARLIQVIGLRIGLVGADLSRADVRGADLFGANLRESNLTDADFSFSRLASANLTTAKLTGAKFVEAELPAGFTPP